MSSEGRSEPRQPRIAIGRRLIRGLATPLLAFAMLGLLTPAAQASKIHPIVQDVLSTLRPTEETTVVFILERQADIPLLDQTLTLEHATRKERHRRVLEALRTAAAESQAPFLAELAQRAREGGVAGYTPYWISNLVVVRATRAAIEDLSNRSEIAAVEPLFRPGLTDPKTEPLPAHRDDGPQGIGVAPGLRAINAPQVWFDLGVTGEGAIVGNLDTGVDGSHSALYGRWRGNHGHPWQQCWHDVLGTGTEFPNDAHGHGTHVMGTLAGVAAATGDTIGVAWGSQWIAANAINQLPGPPFDVDVFDCLQWFADPDGDPNTVDDVPDVVQNSWGVSELIGGSPPYLDCDVRWWGAIDNCEAAGVVLTWSAGGDGPGAGTIRSPADRATTPYNCFSVGSVDAAHYDFPYPIAPFSSRGPTGCEVPAPLNIKPEVVAPGVDIYSSVPGESYEVWSGSGMAGPHVAGVVALMRSVDPDLEVDAIKHILMITARDGGAVGEDNVYGWGTIDAYAAVVTVMAGSGVPPGPSGNPAVQLRLLECRPNPFREETRLRFRMPEEGPASLAVYDPCGRLLRTILSCPLPAGVHTAVWNGRDQAGRRVPAGVYLCRFRMTGHEVQSKVLLVE